jgi:hypothetical protein
LKHERREKKPDKKNLINNTNVESRLIYFPNFTTIYTYLFPGFLTYIIQINDDITQRIYLLLLPK